MSPMPAAPPIKDDPLRIEICRNVEDLARHAAQLFVSEAGRALGSKGRCSVALPGGRTPRRLYEVLTEDHFAFQIVWPAVHLFWSDERCVPPGDDRSNFRIVKETMLSKLSLPEANVHRMRGEDPPEAAAEAAERDLADHFGGPPRFDLVLLGMGADGHTASLFPGGPALDETRRPVGVADGPDGLRRITLTLPAINAASAVAILVSGSDKAETVRRVLGAEARDEGLPVQRIKPEEGRLIWLLDADAATELQMPGDA